MDFWLKKVTFRHHFTAVKHGAINPLVCPSSPSVQWHLVPTFTIDKKIKVFFNIINMFI